MWEYIIDLKEFIGSSWGELNPPLLPWERSVLTAWLTSHILLVFPSSQNSGLNSIHLCGESSLHSQWWRRWESNPRLWRERPASWPLDYGAEYISYFVYFFFFLYIYYIIIFFKISKILLSPQCFCFLYLRHKSQSLFKFFFSYLYCIYIIS